MWANKVGLVPVVAGLSCCAQGAITVGLAQNVDQWVCGLRMTGARLVLVAEGVLYGSMVEISMGP